MQLMSVVLPEPFGPIRPKRSPRAMSRLTPDSAVKPPKCFDTCFIWRSGASICGTSPTMPSGASTTKRTSSTPTTSTLISLEMVTVTICWIEPSSSAPITGPIQCPVPPIIGIGQRARRPS